MRKSILTLVFIASIQMLSFAQQGSMDINPEANMKAVQKIADEKSDITGTFANAGGWNMFVDDTKLVIEGEPIKEFANPDMQSLLRSGFSFAKKNKSKNACYKYRIVANAGGKQKMFLYACGQ